jgi:RNA polymerase sigma factor (sigma-70 family)
VIRRCFVDEATPTRDELILSCLDLVKRIAVKDYRRAHRGSDDRLQDLVQEGNLGLIEAATRFRPGGAPFSNWASLHIHAYIRRHLAAEKERPESGCSAEGIDGLVDHRLGCEPMSAAEADAVREAVADLPIEDQYVLIRIFYDGVHGSEIANDVGLTPSAISTRKTRALAKLRRKLTA